MLLKDQKSFFFPSANPLGFFASVFMECFHFLLLLVGYFHCWLHFFMSPIFFILTTFLLLFCQVLCFCIVIPRVPRIWESFFLPLGVFYVTLLPHIWHNVMLHQPAFKSSLGAGSSSLKLKHWLPICLFELHSVQQTVLLSRLCLCVKAL